MNWPVLVVVAVLILGFWAAKHFTFISAAKAGQLLAQGARIIDVRTPGEFNSRHVPGAINMPLGSLADDVPGRFPDKAQALLLHCLSGGRSEIARRKLMGLGYQNVFNLGSYARAAKIAGGAKARGGG